MKKSMLIINSIIGIIFFLNVGFIGGLSKNNKIVESMIRAMEWQEKNEKYGKGPTDWTNGAYYTGVKRAHQITKNPVFEQAMFQMGKKNNWQTHDRFYHADDIVISSAYLHLKKNGHKEVDLSPTDQWIKKHLYDQHPWKTGKNQGMEKILWWWCDALFMAPPVIAEYSVMKNQPEYLDKMHEYYLESYNYLFDQEEKLFYRDNRYFIRGNENDFKEPNGKKMFWSRGNGWVFAGLALLIDELPEDFKYRGFYIDLYKTMAKRIMELQPKDGLWRTSLLCPEKFPDGEASGSGFHIFALAWGINNGIIEKKIYLPAVKKGWNALMKCQQPNGMIGYVQAIGSEPKPATKDSWFNFGTGAYLLAGSEILKMK